MFGSDRKLTFQPLMNGGTMTSNSIVLLSPNIKGSNTQNRQAPPQPLLKHKEIFQSKTISTLPVNQGTGGSQQYLKNTQA